MDAEAREEERFRREVLESSIAVAAVEKHFRAKGWFTKIDPLTVRPNFEVRKAYGDSCDLLARYEAGDDWKRIEVKGRTFDFTCEQDFPHDTLIVDRATKEKKTEIAFYVSVSKNLRYAAFLPENTRPHWTKQTIFDRKKGHDVTVYLCPKRLAKFVELRSGN